MSYLIVAGLSGENEEEFMVQRFDYFVSLRAFRNLDMHVYCANSYLMYKICMDVI
jgi:hypothetical protein